MMPTVSQYKTGFLSPQAQVVVFHKTGLLKDSCHTFIDLRQHVNQSIFEVFPFLDSIQDSLANLRKEDGELYFPRVEYSHGEKEWVFDYSFQKDEENGECIVWWFQDFTRQYRYLQTVQQERNESIIRRKLAEAENHFVILRKEVEHLNKLQKVKLAYISTVLSELETPLKTIKHATRELKDTTPPTTNATPLSTLQNSANELGNLLQRVSQNYMSALGDVQLEQKEFLLPEVLWSVMRAFDYGNESNKTPIYLNLDKEIPLLHLGDSKILSQVLYNILNDAVKRSEMVKEKSILMKVNGQKQTKTHQTISFCIQDKGTALSKEVVNLVNGRANTAATQTAYQHISFSIVKQLVELQNGVLKVTAQNGGNEVNFTLDFGIVQL
ncbi:MAG: sensor histidine kinase [Chitinophagales bacterium]